MTFIPSVLSKVDDLNSSNNYSGTTQTGTYSSTTGYNSLQINITSLVNSIAGGIVISFSNDKTNIISSFSDTYFNTSNFNKIYPIQAKYYKVNYTSSSSTTFSLTSTLLTETYNEEVNSNNSFNNNFEYKNDAFGKLRVTQPFTLLDIHFPPQSSTSTADPSFLNNTLQLCSKSNAGASAVYGSSKALITVPATTNSYYISQSRIYATYQPGKSLLFKSSGIIKPSANSSNFTSRIGYFDNITPITTIPLVKNGLYFEWNGTNIGVVYSNENNITRIDQNSWNIDKMNGTGSSGLNLDFTKCQLFIIDMEWLGVGRVRFGFYAYGKIIYCHQLTNINILTSPYITSANLPLCFSMHYNGTGTGSGTITQICSTVISEGGYNPIGRPFSYSSGTALTITTSETPLLAIKGGSNNYYHQNIVPSQFTIVDTNQNNYILYRIRIYQAPNSPGSSISWVDVNTNYSVTQSAIGTSITGFTTANSIVASQGYFSGKGDVSFSDLTSIFTDQILHVTSNIDLTSDILVLTAQVANTGSTTVYSSISWKEIY